MVRQNLIYSHPDKAPTGGRWRVGGREALASPGDGCHLSENVRLPNRWIRPIGMVSLSINFITGAYVCHPMANQYSHGPIHDNLTGLNPLHRGDGDHIIFPDHRKHTPTDDSQGDEMPHGRKDFMRRHVRKREDGTKIGRLKTLYHAVPKENAFMRQVPAPAIALAASRETGTEGKRGVPRWPFSSSFREMRRKRPCIFPGERVGVEVPIMSAWVTKPLASLLLL
jgi:hypothetical protein